MKIYLADANRKMQIISTLWGGYKDIRIYLAGGGNREPQSGLEENGEDGDYP